MWSFAHIRPAYSRAERLSDGVVHIVGLGLALIAVPLLITLTIVFRSQPVAIFSVSVYGTSLLLMLGFSALYNMIENDRWSGLFRRLDHSAIYVKIAGTYTPFVLLSSVPATGFLAGLWGSALLGSVLKLVDPNRFRWFALFLYLAMGWAAVWIGGSILAELPVNVWGVMLMGGLMYTVGVAFYLMDNLPFHNTIWHVFVLAGSVLFFVAVCLHVSGQPAYIV